MLYTCCYYCCCHLCCPACPAAASPIWYRHLKFKSAPAVCYRFLCCCRSPADATRLLQRCCCCNTDAATRMLQRGCCFFGGGSGLIKRVAALAVVNNTSAVWGSSSPLLFDWNLTPEMRICISCQLHRSLYREFKLKSLEGQRGDSKRPTYQSLI